MDRLPHQSWRFLGSTVPRASTQCWHVANGQQLPAERVVADVSRRIHLLCVPTRYGELRVGPGKPGASSVLVQAAGEGSGAGRGTARGKRGRHFCDLEHLRPRDVPQ